MDSQSRAEQACTACKKLKRKCDKSFPQCALCLRTGRRCDYATLEPTPTAGDLAILQERLADLEQQLAATPLSSQQSYNSSSSGVILRTETSGPQSIASREFPAALFLDLDCYKWTRMRLPLPSAKIPEVSLARLVWVVLIPELGCSLLTYAGQYYHRNLRRVLQHYTLLDAGHIQKALEPWPRCVPRWP
jgi:hypothetical protein